MIILLMYILGWPLLTRDAVELEVLQLRLRRLRRMRDRLLAGRNELEDEIEATKVNRRLLASVAASINAPALGPTGKQDRSRGMPTRTVASSECLVEWAPSTRLLRTTG